ncbi:uncharacterized protein [Procambarus clarkii]|uniref:uncharacterized protein isoform X3 n=1 Tax=Procambarus clarkii TaxID=6728 RepID=UPI0037435C4E
MPDEASGYVHSEAGEGEIDDNDKSLKSTPDSEGGGNCSSSMCQDILEATWGKDEETRIKSPTLMDQATCLTSNDLPTHTSILTSDDSDSSTSFRGFPEHCTEVSAINVECETQTRNERFIDADGEEFNSTSPSHFFHRTPEVEESQISISSSEKSKACNANNPLINTADKDNLQAQHLVQAKEITNNMKTLKESSAIQVECEMQTRNERFIDADGEEFNSTSLSHVFHKTAEVEENQSSISSSEKEFSAVNVECETQTRNERFIDADGEEFNSTSPSHFFHRTAEVEESQISISSSEKSKACNANNPLINTADKDNLQAQHLVQAKEITNNMKTLKNLNMHTAGEVGSSWLFGKPIKDDCPDFEKQIQEELNTILRLQKDNFYSSSSIKEERQTIECESELDPGNYDDVDSKEEMHCSFTEQKVDLNSLMYMNNEPHGSLHKK